VFCKIQIIDIKNKKINILITQNTVFLDIFTIEKKFNSIGILFDKRIREYKTLSSTNFWSRRISFYENNYVVINKKTPVVCFYPYRRLFIDNEKIKKFIISIISKDQAKKQIKNKKIDTVIYSN